MNGIINFHKLNSFFKGICIHIHIPSKNAFTTLLAGIACVLGLTGQNFKEISLQSQLNVLSDNNGIAVADYDNDNDLDIFVVQRWNHKSKEAVKSQLFRNNNNGSFTNVTEECGISSVHNYNGVVISGIYSFGEKMSASWGDYDNDGFPDLFLTNARQNELYHNNGDGTFTNVTVTAGLPEEGVCYSTGALWFDVNNDSYLDLFVSSIYDCNGLLYVNQGNGTFLSGTEILASKNYGQTSWMAIPWDYNHDTFQDLYISRDFDLPNQFLINSEGQNLTDTAAFLGITDIYKDGMGLSLNDFNNDGLPDIFITNINESSLYQNMDTDTFKNVAADFGFEKTGWAWGCSFTDFDHDLDEDLMLVNGYHDKSSNFYFENRLETGSLTFTDRTREFGLDIPSKSNCLAVFDYDNDGDMDMLISRTEDTPEFFENQTVEETPETGGNNWIKIDLVGTQSNRNAIGALIKIKVENHQLIRYHHGAVFMAQNLIPTHFGLANYTKIDTLTIIWPSGKTEIYTNIEANQFIRYTENQGFEQIIVEAKKIPGCTDPNSCSYNPNATLDDGSCTYLETKSIQGETNAGVLTTQTYTYPNTEGSDYYWQVTNGTILEGQGKSTINIQWHVANHGIITVTEHNHCYSVPAILNVSLNIKDRPQQVSIARLWNEALLSAIRGDYARPTVHARNLFHTSIALYDAWALFNDTADTYLIGKDLHTYQNHFDGFTSDLPKEEAVQIAMSYAAYRVLTHRFQYSPHQADNQEIFDELMQLLTYDTNYTSINYSNGNPAALGNFIGQSIIDYGFQDGSNEANKYKNVFYVPVNDPLVPKLPGNPTISDPNHWQPLKFDVFIDQAGNITSGSTPDFLSPEWGSVYPFSFKEEDATIYSRDGNDYTVYHDPGTPPLINARKIDGADIDLYKWNYAMVAVWSSQLDPADSVIWDISPASVGNIDFNELPRKLEQHSSFYNFFNGGDIGKGRDLNPITGQPYKPQWVARGDYARILAEFWADGPDSETPPGHWFVLLNYIHDHPDFIGKFKGEGPVLSALEWDVKAYFTLGGTMHDAAIASWAIKGWYDYIRPVSAIRYMADMGQSSDPSLGNYSPNGIPLIPGYIEVLQPDDSLAVDTSNIGKIKVLAWKGHSYINNPKSEKVGVGWILAENWWPYQRPTFVTPPFAGYVSGHSTYSRAAAEVVTQLTGSPYFPGGMGEFKAPKNEFLVFEDGPSEDVVLQWATYQDASDQCSLSRIWGGIHPPADDMPGRIIGYTIGHEAFEKAEKIFLNNQVGVPSVASQLDSKVFPFPITNQTVTITNTKQNQAFYLYNLSGALVEIAHTTFNNYAGNTVLSFKKVQPGIYILRSGDQNWKLIFE